MKIDRTMIIYSNQKTGFTKGLRYANPRFVDGNPRVDVTKVVVVGSWPDVEKAYRAAGVAVVQCELKDVAAAVGSVAVAPGAKLDGKVTFKAGDGAEKLTIGNATAPLGTLAGSQPNSKLDVAGSVTDPTSVAIPEGWKALAWGELRKVANGLAGRQVINKEEATQVIEAELARRAKAAQQ